MWLIWQFMGRQSSVSHAWGVEGYRCYWTQRTTNSRAYTLPIERKKTSCTWMWESDREGEWVSVRERERERDNTGFIDLMLRGLSIHIVLINEGIMKSHTCFLGLWFLLVWLCLWRTSKTKQRVHIQYCLSCPEQLRHVYGYVFFVRLWCEQGGYDMFILSVPFGDAAEALHLARWNV